MKMRGNNSIGARNNSSGRRRRHLAFILTAATVTTAASRLTAASAASNANNVHHGEEPLQQQQHQHQQHQQKQLLEKTQRQQQQRRRDTERRQRHNNRSSNGQQRQLVTDHFSKYPHQRELLLGSHNNEGEEYHHAKEEVEEVVVEGGDTQTNSNQQQQQQHRRRLIMQERKKTTLSRWNQLLSSTTSTTSDPLVRSLRSLEDLPDLRPLDLVLSEDIDPTTGLPRVYQVGKGGFLEPYDLENYQRGKSADVSFGNVGGGSGDGGGGEGGSGGGGGGGGTETTYDGHQETSRIGQTNFDIQRLATLYARGGQGGGGEDDGEEEAATERGRKLRGNSGIGEDTSDCAAIDCLENSGAESGRNGRDSIFIYSESDPEELDAHVTVDFSILNANGLGRRLETYMSLGHSKSSEQDDSTHDNQEEGEDGESELYSSGSSTGYDSSNGYANSFAYPDNEEEETQADGEHSIEYQGSKKKNANKKKNNNQIQESSNGSNNSNNGGKDDQAPIIRSTFPPRGTKIGSTQSFGCLASDEEGGSGVHSVCVQFKDHTNSRSSCFDLNNVVPNSSEAGDSNASGGDATTTTTTTTTTESTGDSSSTGGYSHEKSSDSDSSSSSNNANDQQPQGEVVKQMKQSSDIWELTFDGFEAYAGETWQFRFKSRDGAKNKLTTDWSDFIINIGEREGVPTPSPTGVGDGGGDNAEGDDGGEEEEEGTPLLDYVRDDNWPHGGIVQSSTGRILFFINSNPYVCTGTVLDDQTTGRTIILTAAHCAYQYSPSGGKFAESALFIPNQDDTRASRTNEICGDDPMGCWIPAFAVVDQRWTTMGFPNSVPYDYAFYVIPDDAEAYEPGYLPKKTGILDQDVEPIPVDFHFNEDIKNFNIFTHGLGYSFNKDPNFRYCSTDLTTKFGISTYENLWLGICDMTGGSSGGPWMMDMDSNGRGTVVSVNSWGYSSSSGMAGPNLSTESGSHAECLYKLARDTPFDSVTGGGLVATNCY